MSDQNNSVFEQRVASLRELLDQNDLDALIVSHDDEYLSYELNEDEERLKYITGFSGSAGYAVITSNDLKINEENIEINQDNTENGIVVDRDCAVFVDGRYVVQVKEQIDSDIFQDFDLAKVKPAKWISSVMPKNSTVGIDINCVSYKEYISIKNELGMNNINLVATENNLVDKIWTDKPASVISEISIFPDEYNGCPSPQKRQLIAQTLRDKDLDATVICDPESICWLLNIRGKDRAYLPVINCKMVAYSNEALEWYINPNHFKDENLQDQLQEHIGHIDIFPEEAFDDVLDRLCSSSCTVYVDPETTNAHVMTKLYSGGAKVSEGLGLCQMPKACKNHIEVAGEYKAHIKDGIAMCRFISWLDNLTALDKPTDSDETFLRRVEGVDEAELATRALSFRKVEAGFIEPSFATISALGPNAAMCHYNHENEATPRALGKDCLYLIDSGAHFIEGTTDITRTILVGPHITDEIKRMYTLVLKSHIALATLIFPKGTSGIQIDAIARRPLWDCGFDFAHGTGHGVGHVLSVHEGPQTISSRRSTVPLVPGMVLSDEPGYYKEGEYGIRLENLLVVMQCTQPGMQHMLCFSPLTLVPFDKRFIDKELLSQKEIEWLNNYHQNVNNVITNAATSLTEDEITWLNKATAAI
ncbi:MAG: aminopeptidase P family protein [Succinatimonas sp.]|nr:aminopeptidase P family protein [Succinatimonas sp.]MDD6756215.1 aminopeptidase P family protein [Succinatimonas sp.]MDY6247491.1 aminopeptidase P family protein [Succinivibrio sp.]